MKRIVLLCGCLLVWGSAGAQLTLDSCRLLARNHYPEIRRYDLVRQTEEYTLSNARREWLPQLSLSAQATWQTAVPAFPDALTGMLTQYGVGMPGMNKDQYKVQLEVTQTIWTAESRPPTNASPKPKPPNNGRRRMSISMRWRGGWTTSISAFCCSTNGSRRRN